MPRSNFRQIILVVVTLVLALFAHAQQLPSGAPNLQTAPGGNIIIQRNNEPQQKPLVNINTDPGKVTINPDAFNNQTPMSTNYTGKTNVGAVVCGGVVNGKEQPPCGTKAATFNQDAAGACPAGSFLDAGAGSTCWQCPAGYERTAEPVNTARACAKQDRNVKGEFFAAKFAGGLCPPGSFFDPIRGGECYSCPAGYRRSAAHIDADNACFIPAGEDLKPANRVKRGIVICDPGSFYDAYDGGGCWTCPADHNRTGNPINSGQACSRAIGEKIARATVQKKAACDAGEIQDPRNGGECWVCPTATTRTVYPVNGNQACEKWGGYVYANATQTGTLTCPASQFFDPVTSRNSDVVNRIRTQVAGGRMPDGIGRSLGGTCWSCPAGYTRTTTAVWSDTACQSGEIGWQPFTYNQPGLFGLAGAEDVALALLRERVTITRIAVMLAPNLQKSPQDAVLDTWRELATAPHNSVVLKMAVLSRLQAAVDEPSKATPAEVALARSFADAIRNHRTFIAQNALDAYLAWNDAVNFRKAQRNSSAPSLGMLFDYGTVPPDFDDIVASTVLAGVGSQVGMQFALGMTWTNVPRIKNTIFPSARARNAIRRVVKVNAADGPNETLGGLTNNLVAEQNEARALEKAGEKGARELVQEGVEKGAQKLTQKAGAKIASKLLGKLIVKGAETGAKTAFSALMDDGPQAIIGFAVDLLVESITQIIDIQNARPTLETKLATAKQPVDLARMRLTDEGEDAFDGYWAAIMSVNTPPRQPLSSYAQLAGAALSTMTAQNTQNAQPPAAAPQFEIVAANGNCLRVQGLAVGLAACGSGPRWISDRGQLKVAGGTACLTGGPLPGVTICSPVPVPTQLWALNGEAIINGNQCLEARGNGIALAACAANNPAQHWKIRTQ